MPASERDPNESAVISFSIGPVQRFIEAARSLRDLWAGSTLLSWIAFRAMRPILDTVGHDAFVTPSMKDHPLLVGTNPGSRTIGLPNGFLALVPGYEADQLAEACRNAAIQEWRAVAGSVKGELARSLTGFDGWDRDWDAQVNAHFNIRVHAFRLAEWAETTHADLAAETGAGRSEWQNVFEFTGRLLAAQKISESVPNYQPTPGAQNRYPGKCSLLGTFEHLGPADFERIKEFWGSVREAGKQHGRLATNERLCAISLVKRFAPSVYLRRQSELNLDYEDLRYQDVATIASAQWLYDNKIDPKQYRKDGWSGQWLHWAKPHQDDDEEKIPPALFDAIGKARRLQPVPAYYAVIVMDGDRMGDRLCGARSADDLRAISHKLLKFSIEVQSVVESDAHRGALIYAGGDDLLALLPVDAALPCAKELNEVFRRTMGDGFTLSAGIAVVHIKEDLRFALEQARVAEKRAKSAGRDRVGLRICRRSGEHSESTMLWEWIPDVAAWTDAFKLASDRWVYHLRGEEETLKSLEKAAQCAEIRRQIRRSDDAKRNGLDAEKIIKFYEDNVRAEIAVEHDRFPAFVTLLQSASFLARGRDA